MVYTIFVLGQGRPEGWPASVSFAFAESIFRSINNFSIHYPVLCDLCDLGLLGGNAA
jgi:hypothetical protein